MLNFADSLENYSLILQDAKHGYHRANNQAVIRPFTVYIKDQRLHTLPFCVISNSLDRNMSPFYAFERTVVQYPCTNFLTWRGLQITLLQWSSIQEQKKCINIYQRKDFGLSAEWHFLASHGKMAGDGRRTVKKWLQGQVSNNQIQTL
jgi:hypothetical protein